MPNQWSVQLSGILTAGTVSPAVSKQAAEALEKNVITQDYDHQPANFVLGADGRQRAS